MTPEQLFTGLSFSPFWENHEHSAKTQMSYVVQAFAYVTLVEVPGHQDTMMELFPNIQSMATVSFQLCRPKVIRKSYGATFKYVQNMTTSHLLHHHQNCGSHRHPTWTMAVGFFCVPLLLYSPLTKVSSQHSSQRNPFKTQDILFLCTKPYKGPSSHWGKPVFSMT